MARRRSEDLRRIAELCDPVIEVVDERDGWPGAVEVRLASGPTPISLHVGPIGLSHRDRDDVERRFQNPLRQGTGKPVAILAGTLPVLIGLWEEALRPVLVGMDAELRIGKETRQSLFIPLLTLNQAAESGWSEHYSTSDELIIAFHPALLPAYLDLRLRGTQIDGPDLRSVLRASGLLDDSEQQAAERVRRSVTQLVRSSSFGASVVAAYGGVCAMCGFNFGLIQGAHIYPAAAPNSTDSLKNGIALCSNHHTAFDAHLVFVDPDEATVQLNPELHRNVSRSDACEAFVSTTFAQLALPRSRADWPSSAAFLQRYNYFAGKYDWAS